MRRAWKDRPDCNPSTPATGDWPAYEAGRREVMVLGGPAGAARVSPAPREAMRSTWDEVFSGDE